MADISIVIPVYNCEKYLHKCIRSVLEENQCDLELIVVDDGSSDNSFNICKYYQENDRRVILTKKSNEGAGATRNTGIRLATGRYIYFLDSDDYVAPGTLSTLLHYADKEGLDICSPVCPPRYYDKGLEYVSCLPSRGQFMRRDLIRQYSLLQPTSLSGQDGVFSHLFLTVAERFGVVRTAYYKYVAARPGSLYSKFMSDHASAHGIVQSHYEYIFLHYDRWGLWDSNSLRLAHFFEDETLENRVIPHYRHLNKDQQSFFLEQLVSIGKRIFQRLEQYEKVTLSDVTLDIMEGSKKEAHKKLTTKDATLQKKVLSSRHNIVGKNVIIVKYAHAKYSFSQSCAKPAPSDAHTLDLRDISNKLDFCLCSLNNLFINAPTVFGEKKECKHDVVVSITTTVHRLPIIHKAIESIFRQTITPKNIVLYISNTVSREYVNEYLSQYIDRGLFIEYVEDVGPHTKLLYALQQFPDNPIVTMDDDVIYPDTALQYLLNMHNKFPKAIICNWARELVMQNGCILPIRSGKLLTPPFLEKNPESSLFIPTENIRAFPYGSGGVLYPPRSLAKEVFNREKMLTLTPTEDDIWFKAMSLLQETMVVPTNLGWNPRHHSSLGTQFVALRHQNHDNNKQLTQLRNTFSEYGLDKYLSEHI